MPHMLTDTEEVYACIDVARRSNLSTQRIRQLADAGKLPALRTPGGQHIFRKEDVERFLAMRRRK